MLLAINKILCYCKTLSGFVVRQNRQTEIRIKFMDFKLQISISPFYSFILFINELHIWEETIYVVSFNFRL